MGLYSGYDVLTLWIYFSQRFPGVWKGDANNETKGCKVEGCCSSRSSKGKKPYAVGKVKCSKNMQRSKNFPPPRPCL